MPTKTSSVSMPDGHIVDPACQSRGSHGYLRSYSHQGCRCPGPGMEQYLAYRERQAISKRASYMKQGRPDRPPKADLPTKRADRLEAPSSLGELWNRDDRACIGTDLSLWFPVGAGDDATIRQARSICRGCPVSELCLRAAIESGDDHAILGGLLPKERRRLKTAHGVAA